MALTLLRHGALHPQHQGCYNGWSDLEIDPSRFNPSAVQTVTDQRFDRIYSSDLRRCTQTLALMGYTDIITDARLREVRFKEKIEGKRFDDITKLPDYDPALLETPQRWHEYICAEREEDFEQRIQSFLKELPREENILICSHAGTIRKMLYFLGIAKDTIDYLESIRIESDHLQRMV